MADKLKKAICKFRGMLVVAEFSRCKEGSTGRCPDCGATQFHRKHGWVECDCGFAIDEKSYDSMEQEAQ